METLLKNLANRLKAYGATYKVNSSYRGTLTLGEAVFNIEINIRQVARIEGERFLFGSRRGHDLNAMVTHILRLLPRQLEKTAQEREWREACKTKEQIADAVNELNKVIRPAGFYLDYNSWSSEDQLKLHVTVDSPVTAASLVDYIQEFDPSFRGAKQVEANSGPRVFAHLDENGEPSGAPLTLKDLANSGVDLDRAVALIVGEAMNHEDFQIMRMA